MIKAYVNHGRWLARCPKCGVANEIKKTQSSFTCGSLACRPQFNNVFYEIEFELKPDNVEKLLRPRKAENMHWYPGETLKDLDRENREHGIRVKK